MILQRKVLVLLAVCLLLIISIMIGGCSTMETKTVTKPITYPDRPITIIVPFNAGGAADMIARALEKTATQHLGQPLIVVNKPGGAGTLAWNELASTTPDGYTIGITGSEVMLQPLYGLTKYNYPTALEPLVQVSSSPMVMAVQAGQPWQNVDGLVRYARQHPGQTKFGNSGVGSLPHVIGEMVAHTTDISIEHVPFRGGAETLAALLGGHVQAIFINPATIKEHIKAGTIRALAVTTAQRLTDPVFANVPTLKEQGMDIEFSYWMGVAAPKEMPIEVKTKLVAGLEAIIIDPVFQKNLENIGVQVEYLNFPDSQTKWLSDSKKLSEMVRETSILDQIKEQKNN
jgi:tripartite-type tricarboxylate transporter receptor subunit TctC